MSVKDYKELIVWQKAMLVAEQVYVLVKKLPKEELFALSDQMRRCAVSIPSNIAEGQERNTTADFLRFVGVAQGSRSELETQLLLCERVGYLKREDTEVCLGLLKEIGKMLNTIVSRLSNDKSGQ
jgi:four helix bundle protein